MLIFDFTPEHVLGVKMEKADKLNKRLDWKVGVENDNKKEELIHSLAEVVVKELKVNILEKIKIARKKNKEVVRVVKEIKKPRVKVLKGDEQQVEENLVLKEGKVYMLKDKELRVEIMQLYHDVLVAGHRRRWKTTELVMRNYWWL